MTATTGNRCDSICPQRPFAISPSRTTTSPSATHGRGFWILDDITPLRQLDDKVIAGNAYLFEPELTYRVRWNMNTDTPLPPDVPAGQNPPDGAVIDYYLKSAASGPVTLEILDSTR